MTEIYSLIINFPGGLESSKLHTEISLSAVTINLIGISTCGDVVEIVFNSALGSSDRNIVSVIIAAHVPAGAVPKIFTKVAINKTCSAKDWEIVSVFSINDKMMFDTDSISILSKMSGNLTSYDVRFYDFTNDNILTQANFTNAAYALMNTGTVLLTPIHEVIIELHIKVNGYVDSNDCVFISEINYYET